MAESTVVRTKFDKKTKPNRSARPPDRGSRYNSIIAIEELLQCGICLEKLQDSRMLPCQHTFCLACLKSHLAAKALMNNEQDSGRDCLIKCPICHHQVHLENGVQSIEKLPKNLYIDSLLKVVEDERPPSSPKTPDYRCVKCQIISQDQQCCKHCMQNFCHICWNQHLSELESNLSILVQQVDESKNRLDHKLENFETRCDHLDASIRETVEKKIGELKQQERQILEEVKSMKSEKKIVYNMINKRISEIKSKLKQQSFDNNSDEVLTFMALHNETSNLLKDVSHFGEARLIFDPENFRLEQTTKGTYNEIDEPEIMNNSRIVNPLESIDTMARYYRTRSFIPKLIWNKCPRPGHVGIPPWDTNLLYICATDTHTVLILKRDKGKLEGRLTAREMLYPIGVAFSNMNKEIFISDKWQHCIHVFSNTGEYLRQLCSKGTTDGRLRNPDGIAITTDNNLLVISDSGNDRVITIDPNNGKHISTIDKIKNKTRLNMPMGIAVIDDKIIVADTGNHRIKVFNLIGDYLLEFGSLGRGRGQFHSAEVVTVDPLGFILVGDGGNARIQVFNPDGSLVKIFGNDDFGWVSGICVSQELDIITTDNKTRALRIF